MSKITVFYMPEQVAKTDSFSKSPRKPKIVVDAWQRIFPANVEVAEFEPVTSKQLKLVHSERYVDGVLSGKIPNGFGNYDKAVSDSLLYTSGSMLAAARHALKAGVAVAPVSGFHHACHNGGGGFCTFEGLALTAKVLKDEKLVKRVGICDCDMHWGNGSADIINRLGFKFIEHFSAGKNYHVPEDASDFFDRLPSILNRFKGVDVLLYQAGADPWVGDELGGWLTMSELAERDRIVFKFCKENGIPLAWNLAGGYAAEYQDTITIHVHTMYECIQVYHN